jgi:hypothetical protein
MYSAMSVLRAIRPGANRALHPAERGHFLITAVSGEKVIDSPWGCLCVLCVWALQRICPAQRISTGRNAFTGLSLSRLPRRGPLPAPQLPVRSSEAYLLDDRGSCSKAAKHFCAPRRLCNPFSDRVRPASFRSAQTGRACETSICLPFSFPCPKSIHKLTKTQPSPRKDFQKILDDSL